MSSEKLAEAVATVGKESTTLFGALAGDEAAWKSILELLDRDHGMDLRRGLSHAVGAAFPGIDRGLDLGRNTLRDGTFFTGKPDEFRPFHAESLLDQAAALLERGLRDRWEWEELSGRKFELALEIEQFRRIEEIHKEEEAAEPHGYYEWVAAHAALEAQAERIAVEGAGSVAQALSELGKLIAQRRDALVHAARRAANLAHFPVFEFDRPSMRHADLRAEGKDKDVNDNLQRWKYPDPERNYPAGEAPKVPEENTFPHIASELAAAAQTGYALDIQARQVALDQGAAEIAVRVAAARRDAAQVRAAWETANSGFAKRRTTVGIQAQRRRALEAERPGGVLNYTERLVPLALRFERDLREAVLRMAAAAAGLGTLYGYDELLPTQAKPGDPFPPEGEIEERAFYEQCLRWARDATSFLLKFSHLDQSYVQPVSVRSQLSASDWDAGRKAGSWTIRLSEATFKDLYGDDQFHVRLRGASAFVLHADASSVWHVKLQPPKSSFSRPLPDASGTDRPPRVVDQSDLAPCRIGRVMPRAHPTPPDVVGIASLHNASPFGDWVISIHRAALSGQPVDSIEDVQLDLHLAFRSA